MFENLKFNLVFQGLNLGKSRAEIDRAFYERFGVHPSEDIFDLAKKWICKGR